MKLCRSIGSVLLLAVLSSASAAPSWDLATDFSSSTNANGAWSYGWSSVLGSSFVIDTDHVTFPIAGGSVSEWRGDVAGDGNPAVLYWSGTPGSNLSVLGISVPANNVTLHPGPGGQYAVARWTAPTAGQYSISTSFIGRDATTTDVHVLVNGVDYFSDHINGYGNAKDWLGNAIDLMAGNIVDVAVGFGNGNFFQDTTQVDFHIDSLGDATVPEPATLPLFAGALAIGIWALQRRPRKLNRMVSRN